MTTQDSTKSVSTTKGSEFARKIGNVVAKSRLADGFTPHTPADQEKAVAAWMEVFVRQKIPPAAVNRCYLAALDARIAVFNGSGKMIPMSAALVAAQWTASVRDEMDRENKQKRLTSGRVDGCPDCFGTNIVNEKCDGRYYPTGERCTHKNYNGEENE